MTKEQKVALIKNLSNTSSKQLLEAWPFLVADLISPMNAVLDLWEFERDSGGDAESLVRCLDALQSDTQSA